MTIYGIGKRGQLRRRRMTCATRDNHTEHEAVLTRDELEKLGLQSAFYGCVCPEPQVVKVSLASIFRYIKEEVRDWWETQNRQPERKRETQDAAIHV